VAVRGLPRGLTPVRRAGGFGLPFAAPLPSRIEDSFRRQLDGLPDPARRLLLVVAADPSGDPVLARRAAGRLGIPARAAGPAVEAGLLEVGARLWVRDPLVRSAAYPSGSPQGRQEGAFGLGGGTATRVGSGRRAWPRGAA